MSYEFALLRNGLRAVYAALNRGRDDDVDPCETCGEDAYSWMDGRCMNPECPTNEKRGDDDGDE